MGTVTNKESATADCRKAEEVRQKRTAVPCRLRSRRASDNRIHDAHSAREQQMQSHGREEQDCITAENDNSEDEQPDGLPSVSALNLLASSEKLREQLGARGYRTHSAQARLVSASANVFGSVRDE